MEKKEKKPVTLYLDISVSEMLNTYCYMANRNKTRVMNEAIKDYLEDRLKNECIKEGLIE